MNTKRQKRLTTRKMVAQYYMDMSKYFLVILIAFSLFDKSTQGTIVRPIVYIVVLLGIFISDYLAHWNLKRIDEVEEEDSIHNHTGKGDE